MKKEDLDKLEQLANAAKEAVVGQYQGKWSDFDFADVVQEEAYGAYYNPIARYLLSANPDIILSLISKLRKAEKLVEALEHLSNEAQGFLSMADSQVHGNTNIKCLDNRLIQARAALAEWRGEG